MTIQKRDAKHLVGHARRRCGRVLQRLRARRPSRPWIDPPLPMPSGVDEAVARKLVASVSVDGAPPAELEGYWREAFGRFLRTWDLAQHLNGKALELGANPYFLTVLMHEFSQFELTLANYFGPRPEDTTTQRVTFESVHGQNEALELTSYLFDAERDTFPFEEAAFDVVFFCEILEHMTEHPLATLRQINRVLTPGGHMILTTPNVARLENVARMVLGENLYDPYSGYGPTGRHNREYNCHELTALLRYAGFEVELMFTADSHPPLPHYAAIAGGVPGIGADRARDLGQYIFCRARKVGEGRALRPSFLYRSYPAGEIEDIAGA
jgi:SAM-dependent methyltransferase